MPSRPTIDTPETEAEVFLVRKRSLMSPAMDATWNEMQLVAQIADELLVLFHSDGLPVHGKCGHSVSLLYALCCKSARIFSITIPYS